ncbi:MAG: hypothetical protein Q4G45_09005 [Actinomycetia bacterium]|nr:hypothetical protein [Actinomycetes bacterium]
MLGHTDLLVVWQHPATKRFVVIGRLARDGEGFTFAYTRAAAQVERLRPLPGLPFGQRYHGATMPPVFLQRVMSSAKPDFVRYVSGLGLSPTDVTPWEQIVHSGGQRNGDTLQFIPLPYVEQGRAKARFLVNGIQHVPGAHRLCDGREIVITPERHSDVLDQLRAGDRLRIEAELNEQDDHACLLTKDEEPVGWVPRILSRGMRELSRESSTYASVVRAGGADVPPHLRVVVEVNTTAPPGFRFDPEGEWLPDVE